MGTTHFNKLLTSRVAGIHLNWRKSCEFSAKVRAGCLPNTRRSGDKDGSEEIRPILARFLEPRFQARGPKRFLNTQSGCRMKKKSPIV